MDFSYILLQVDWINLFVSSLLAVIIGFGAAYLGYLWGVRWNQKQIEKNLEEEKIEILNGLLFLVCDVAEEIEHTKENLKQRPPLPPTRIPSVASLDLYYSKMIMRFPREFVVKIGSLKAVVEQHGFMMQAFSVMALTRNDTNDSSVGGFAKHSIPNCDDIQSQCRIIAEEAEHLKK